VVRRIFTDYNAGLSPIAIAKKLNAEGVPGPSGGAWRHTTITGSRKRMTGILRNPLYIGKVVWGRNFNVHNPVTGKRLMRVHDSSKFFSIDLSDFAIIDEDVWTAAQKRLAQSGGTRLPYRPRARHLLSGLVRCEQCGGPFTIENRDRLHCSNHRNKGTCTVSNSIPRAEVENRVLDAITTKLSDPEIIAIYREEYIRERKEKMKTATDARPALLKREGDLKLKLDRLTEHMVSDELNPAAMTIVRQQINKAAEDLQIVQTELAQSPAVDDVEVPRNFADRLAQQLPNLRRALEADDQNATVGREIVRSMINEIRIQPTPGAEARIDCPWDISVSGPIQAVLEMPEVPDFSEDHGLEGIFPLARRGLMVAPDGFEPPTKGL
jgi:site-specific DNA recombinase